MIAQQSAVIGALVLVGSVCISHAGPCQHEIDRIQARVDARLEALTRVGPAAAESAGALLHRQPTPSSIAAAEAKLGDATAGALAAGMARARESDASGNQSACEQALAEVKRLLGP
jgi:hypothetical protein